MILYGDPGSTSTRKVLMVLGEKGHRAELVKIDLLTGAHKVPEHLARQPFGRIPVLDDDGFRLFEAQAIARYLDDKLEGPRLVPGDVRRRAAMEQWISVEASEFAPPAMQIIYQRYFHSFMGLSTDEAVVERASTQVSYVLGVLDRALVGSRYLTGEEFTLADVSFMPCVEYLFSARAGHLITERHEVARWWRDASRRPSWRAIAGKSAD